MIQNFLLAISFFTRLPIPRRDFGNIRLSQCAFAFPLAGAAIGAMGGAVFLMALWLGVNAAASAWLSIIFSLALTGGLHEDGLADTADGLAAGRSREQKLAIMRDSRIGSYGVLALISIISLKAAIISGLGNSYHAIFILTATGAASRAFIAVLMYSLKPARKDGLAETAGKPGVKQTIAAIFLGILILFIAANIPAAAISLAALAIAYIIIKNVTYSNFGGITGDTLGAAQQVSEIVVLIILSSHLFT